jgi:hypothetical protein
MICHVCGKETNRKQRLYCSDKCGLWWNSTLVQERFNQNKIPAFTPDEFDKLTEADFKMDWNEHCGETKI